MFAAIPQDGSTVTTHKMIPKVYGRHKEEPPCAAASITAGMRSLLRKIGVNREPFKIERFREGGGQMQFTVVRKKAR